MSSKRTGRVRHPLSPEAQRAAQRLRLIWEAKRGLLRLTQERAAIQCGWTTQGSFSQYVLGTIPIGMEALLRISGVLQVHPSEIYPELAALLPSLMVPESRLTPHQQELLIMMDSLTAEQQKKVHQYVKETKDHNEDIVKALRQKRPGMYPVRSIDDLEPIQ